MSGETVYAVQHVSCEAPSLITKVLRARGVALDNMRPFRGDRIPRQMGCHARLVVMGGPMGAYEYQQYPFLEDEIRLIQDALHRDLTPKARLEVFEQSAHMPILEEAERYLDVLRRFLRDVEGST